jgi:precorrin-8X/cobalt-precorrin-8 methylmutase
MIDRAELHDHDGVGVHPIETESYAILRSRVDLTHLPPWTRAAVERIVHASADESFAATTTADEGALAAAARALCTGTSLVTDVAMVAAGIRRDLLGEIVCRIADPAAAALAAARGLTRSAAAVHLAAAQVGPGAVWVVGCAPTALAEIVALRPAPLLVIGLPVGFVGAAEAKAALRASGLPHLSNLGEKGGSAVAAAAVNALLLRQHAAGGHRAGRTG